MSSLKTAVFVKKAWNSKAVMITNSKLLQSTIERCALIGASRHLSAYHSGTLEH